MKKIKTESIEKSGSILFVPHGGGPLPLLGDEGYSEMVYFLKEITPTLGNPSAIIVISAHWEESQVTITSGKTPALIYDYYGFPDKAYEVKYTAPGNPSLANKIYRLLQKGDIESKLDEHRGFDHGLFVPLKIMYPEATIPCIQLSLVKGLIPKIHIQIGKVLSKLRNENILIIGSGMSFHNLKVLMSQNTEVFDHKNEVFQQWLISICTNNNLLPDEREKNLIGWSDAPFARYCHPREEHLLPLHVCYGIANSVAKLAFAGNVTGKKVCAFRW